MALRSQRTDGIPIILWITWTAGETEYHEPLCRGHRDYIFERYRASAHGHGRKGDECVMCLGRSQLTGS
jgi:hypothetical protein